MIFICYNIFRSKLIFLIILAKSNRKGGYMLKLKKSAAYLLSVLLILSTVLILPFTVSAAEDEGEAVTAGITGDCTWSADGNVDILDAMEIQKFASGKITEFKK